MPIINNPTIYELAKEEADKKYSKPSAFKSQFIVKKYKELGGTYLEDGKSEGLTDGEKRNGRTSGTLIIQSLDLQRELIN